MTELPLPTPNRRKLVFAGIVLAIFLVFLGIFLLLSNMNQPASGKGFTPKTKEVVIWTVNMPTTLFDTLGKGFNDYLGRKDMKIKARDFSSYEDLLEVLPRSVQANASPDVIVVPNH